MNFLGEFDSGDHTHIVRYRTSWCHGAISTLG